jgi:hypothetical protein
MDFGVTLKGCHPERSRGILYLQNPLDLRCFADTTARRNLEAAVEARG